MKRFPIFLSLLLGVFLLAGMDGCSSDPNVEGAKLDLNNKDYDRALRNLETALDKNPVNAEALELKGRVLSAQAFATTEQAAHISIIHDMIESFQSAAEIDPTYSEAVGRSMSFAYHSEFQRGIQAFNRGSNDDIEFAVAARYFRAASDIRPDSASAYVNEAFAYMNASQPDNAIAPFEDAIAAGDTDPDTFRFLSSLYVSNERVDEAITLLESASSTHPENVDIQTELLNAYQVGGRIDKALEQYSTAVDRDPENQLFRYNYGSLLVQVGDYDGALVQLEEAVRIDPEYSSAYYNIGAAYINQAVDTNTSISDLDDKLRSERSDLSRDQISEREAVIDALVEERRVYFESALPSLETAKSLFEANSEDVTDVCRALFQSYAQTNQTDKAQSVSECAGYEED